jgi:hypothetical protein
MNAKTAYTTFKNIIVTDHQALPCGLLTGLAPPRVTCLCRASRCSPVALGRSNINSVKEGPLLEVCPLRLHARPEKELYGYKSEVGNSFLLAPAALFHPPPHRHHVGPLH